MSVSYKVMNSCRGCKCCYRVCPVGAIQTNPIRITEEKCISCGLCRQACPSKKIIQINKQES